MNFIYPCNSFGSDIWMWHNLGKTWQAALCVKYTNNNKSLVLQQDVKWDTRTGGATYNLLRERERGHFTILDWFPTKQSINPYIYWNSVNLDLSDQRTTSEHFQNWNDFLPLNYFPFCAKIIPTRIIIMPVPGSTVSSFTRNKTCPSPSFDARNLKNGESVKYRIIIEMQTRVLTDSL